jgi:hypothetical protein
MVVSTTHTAVDLTLRKLTVPLTISATPMTHYNQPSSNHPTLTVLNQLFLPLNKAQAEIAHLWSKNARLQSIVASNFIHPPQASSILTDFTATSTITVSVEKFQSLSDKYDSILLILQSLQKAEPAKSDL